MKCPDCKSLINNNESDEDYKFCFNCGGRVIESLSGTHLITDSWWISPRFIRTAKAFKTAKKVRKDNMYKFMEYDDIKLNIEFGYLKANYDGSYSLTKIGIWGFNKLKRKGVI